MNFTETMAALAEGKLMMRAEWNAPLREDSTGIYFCDPENLSDDLGIAYDFERADFEANDWIVYE